MAASKKRLVQTIVLHEKDLAVPGVKLVRLVDDRLESARDNILSAIEREGIMLPSNPYRGVGDVEIRTIEECAEVIHILSKVQRFGWDDYHPIECTPNRVLVRREINDLRRCLDELERKV